MENTETSGIEPKQDKFPLVRLIENLRNKKELKLKLAEAARSQLIKALSRPNPEMAEISFIGIGQNGVIEQIYVPEDNSLSTKRGEEYLGGRLYQISTNLEEMRLLIEKVIEDGNITKLMFFGHTHPSGSHIVDNRKIISVPRQALLVPSPGDLEAVKETKISIDNVDLAIPYEAIAANTELGFALRIYKADELASITTPGKTKQIRQQTIFLQT